MSRTIKTQQITPLGRVGSPSEPTSVPSWQRGTGAAVYPYPTGSPSATPSTPMYTGPATIEVDFPGYYDVSIQSTTIDPLTLA